MDNATKKYKCELSYCAEDVTTGTMMLTEEEYEFAKRLTNSDNWDDLDYNSWCGSLSVYCEELEKSDKLIY